MVIEDFLSERRDKGDIALTSGFIAGISDVDELEGEKTQISSPYLFLAIIMNSSAKRFFHARAILYQRKFNLCLQK